MTDLATYGTFIVKELEISSIASQINSTLGTGLKGRLRLEAKNDNEDDSVSVELHETNKSFAFSHLTLVSGVADSESTEDATNKGENDTALALVTPSTVSESEIITSKKYLPRLTLPTAVGVTPIPWVLNNNTEEGTVRNVTTGNYSVDESAGWNSMAIYSPMIAINTKFVYQEFELMVKGSNVVDVPFTTELVNLFGLITKTSYEASPNNGNWGINFGTYTDGSIRISTNLTVTTQNSMIIGMGDDGTTFGRFLFDKSQTPGDADTYAGSGNANSVLPVTDWYKKGLRVQIGVAHYTATTNSQIEMVFIYEGVRKNYASVTVGPNSTDGPPLASPLNATLNNMKFIIAGGPSGTTAEHQQTWRIPVRPLYKYFGDIFDAQTNTPWRVV